MSIKYNICAYEKCDTKFKLTKDNPTQKYCNNKCWKLANNIGGKDGKKK